MRNRTAVNSPQRQLTFLRRLQDATSSGGAAGVVADEQFRRSREPCIVLVRGKDGWRLAATGGAVNGVERLPTDGSALQWLTTIMPSHRWRCEEIYDGRRHVARLYCGGDSDIAETKALCLMAAPYLGIEQRRARVQAVRRQLEGFVHDFNQPLATLSLSLALLDPSDECQRRHAERCARALDRQRELLEELPYLTGGEQGKREPVALEELLVVVADDARIHADARHVTIRHTLAPAAVIGSRCALRRAFGNVLLNAVQLTPEHSTVRILLQRRRGVVLVEIRDEGPGVRADQRQRVFEPFVSERPGGTGLGLAVARAVAEGHGATVQFVRGPGGRVRFEFPDADASTSPASGIDDAAPSRNGEDHARKRRRGPRVRLQVAARVARPRRRGGHER